MKEHEVRMVFDLTIPEQANIYNSMRSLDGIKNAIVDFRKKLIELKEEYEAEGSAVTVAQVQTIEDLFVESFKSNGINV